MYLVGTDHPHKGRARELLERLVEARERLVTDAEVFQEILHRYTAIRRRDAIGPAWRVLEELTDEVFAIDIGHVETARDLLLENEQLSACDALHVAVMAVQGVERILSFDTGFDRVESVRRVF